MGRQQATLINQANQRRRKMHLDVRPAFSSQIPAHQIQQFQTMIGNQVVQRLAVTCPVFPSRCPFGGVCRICPSHVQTRLKIAQSIDKCEQEADRVANSVMRKPDSISNRQMGEEEKPVQIKEAANGVSKVTSSAAMRICPQRGGGQPLAEQDRAFFEPRFGHGFSDVRVHVGTSAAQAIGARAFTVGHDLVFGAGEYAPGTTKGRHLLAHELTHVIQQRDERAGNAGAITIFRAVDERNIFDHENSSVQCGHRARHDFAFSRVLGVDPVFAIRAADARAILLLNRVIEFLTLIRDQVRSRPRAERSGLLSNLLTPNQSSAFGFLSINPIDPTVWTHIGWGTVHRIVRWCTRIRDTLTSGILHYICWDRSCPGVLHAWGCADPGDPTIGLAFSFWQPEDEYQGRIRDYRALTLIHEVSHIVYSTEDQQIIGGRGDRRLRRRGPLGLAWCFENFVSEFNGIPVRNEMCHSLVRPMPYMSQQLSENQRYKKGS